MSDITEQKDSTWTKSIPLVIVLLVAAIGFFTLREHLTLDALRDNRAALLAFRDDHLLLTIAAFLVTYIVIVAFSLPGAAVASLTGGFLFGIGLGTTLNVLAATTGATAIFLAARMGLGERLADKINASDGSLRKLREGLEKNEWSMLFLIRLIPVVPFFVANLLPALLNVRVHRYVISTVLGIIPGALVFTSIGSGLGEVFASGREPDLSLIWAPEVLFPILGLCALALLPILLRPVLTKLQGRSE